MRQLRLTGIDQIKRHLSSVNSEVYRVAPRTLDMNSLVSNDFMRRYTRFWSIEDMQNEFRSMYGVELTYSLLDSELFNKFINLNSGFKRWRDLLNKASEMNMNRLVRRALVI